MINYSLQYFGKDLTDLVYEDMESYFLYEKEESDKIEFKAYYPKYGNLKESLDGVIRGICGFLNSNGGILIWGSPLGTKVKNRTIFVGPLALVDTLIDKDRLINKVSDSITPLPININVKSIEKGGSYLYVFEIQKSDYSPHQFRDIYWARLDGQTKPAPHYLVDALFKKVTYPHIEGFINLERIGFIRNTDYFLDVSIMMVNFSALQNEYDVSYRLMCPQAVFHNSTNPNKSKNYAVNGHLFINKGDLDILHMGLVEQHEERLLFNMATLMNEGGEMDLHLDFGGRLSPLKYSVYKLNFNREYSHEKPVALFQDIEENVLAVDKMSELGTTREKLLTDLLIRPKK